MLKINLYLDLALTIAAYATCNKLQVGCVLVNNDRILSMGYNGSPRGQKHCIEEGCELVNVDGRDSCKRAVHAEANAIINAAYAGASTSGSILFATCSPCYDCAKLLVNAGVSAIIFLEHYDDQRTWTLWGLEKENYTGLQLKSANLVTAAYVALRKDLIKEKPNE